MKGLLKFSVGVRELRQEVVWITAFGPGFCEVGTNGSGGTADLIDQRIALLGRPLTGKPENPLLQFKGRLVDL